MTFSKNLFSLSCACISGLTLCGSDAASAPAPPALSLVPYPRQVTPHPGVFTVRPTSGILVGSQMLAADTNGVKLFNEYLAKLSGAPLPVERAAAATESCDILFDGFGSYPLIAETAKAWGCTIPTDLPAEGYWLCIRESGILVAAADRRAMVCAALTLEQLCRQEGDAIVLPCCDIVDYPQLSLRICQMQVPALTVQGWNLFDWRAKKDPRGYADFKTMKDGLPILEQMTRAALQLKMNAVMIDLCNVFRFESYPEMALPQAVPLSDLQPIIDLCRMYYAEPIPALNLLAHQEHFLAQARPDLMLVKLAEFPKKRVSRYEEFFYWEPVYDPNNPEVRRIVSAVIDETVKLFRPRYLHIGHDECGALRFVPRKHDKEIRDLFSGSVNFLHDYLKKHNVQTMMWGDMFLNQRMFPSGAAHGAYPGAPIAAAIDDIPKDVIITDWHYWPYTRHYPDAGGPRQDFPSSLYFSDQGFDVIGTTLAKLAANEKQIKALKRHRAHSRNYAAYVGDLPEPGTGGEKGAGLGMMVSHWYLGPRWLPELSDGRATSVTTAAEQFWNAGQRLNPITW